MYEILTFESMSMWWHHTLLVMIIYVELKLAPSKQVFLQTVAGLITNRVQVKMYY